MTAPEVVSLGFEVGTGKAVEIPIRHLAVTGQTQLSGKTTTLEALVTRSGMTALTFITKRGEASFTTGRRVTPYFRDRADWQFVTSIIDATLQEKNKFLRPWIMKICRTTRTLAEVQERVREALKTAKGLNEGVYTQLDAYLDLIVPEIGRADLAPSLDLVRGLNVMDVSSFAAPMQMLFLQSALDWVNDYARNTIVVIPEAWEFIPEGKGSPVKASAIALVRKGAGIGNHIWVDSQDMAGVDKTILRGCAVWLIGVQREANELKRNLANIPAGISRPPAAEIALLERGQFYVCWGRTVIKVYVQPSWMSVVEAHAISIGATPMRRPPPPQQPLPQEDAVDKAEASRLTDENTRLRKENHELQSRVANLEAAVTRSAAGSQLPRTEAAPPPVPFPIDGTPLPIDREFESLFQAIKERAARDPGVLALLASRPELQVTVERRVISVDETTTVGRMAILISEGFFDQTATGNSAFNETKRRNWGIAKPTVYDQLDKITRLGFLTKEADGYRVVPGMKVNIVDRKAA